MLIFFPLVMATPVAIKKKSEDKDNKEKDTKGLDSKEVKNAETINYRNLFSQLLMEVITKMGIDGIVYLSMKGKDDYQYPHGVNLALSAFDITEKNNLVDIVRCFQLHIQKKVLICKEEIKKLCKSHLWRL